MKPQTPFRKASEIFEQLKKRERDAEEKHKLLYIELPRIFDECSLKERRALIGWHLHQTLMAGKSNGQNLILRGLASFFKDYGINYRTTNSSDAWAELGIDEEQRYNLYRSGIIEWFHFQEMRDGVLSLFEWPHHDLGHTIAYMDKQVRKKWPEFSGLIDVIIQDINREWQYRRLV